MKIMKTAYEIENDAEMLMQHLKNEKKFSCDGFKVNKKADNIWEITDKDKKIIKQCNSELEVLKVFLLQLSINKEDELG